MLVLIGAWLFAGIILISLRRETVSSALNSALENAPVPLGAFGQACVVAASITLLALLEPLIVPAGAVRMAVVSAQSALYGRRLKAALAAMHAAEATLTETMCIVADAAAHPLITDAAMEELDAVVEKRQAEFDAACAAVLAVPLPRFMRE